MESLSEEKRLIEVDTSYINSTYYINVFVDKKFF